VLPPLNAVNRVDIYTDPNLRLSFGSQPDKFSATSISVFPNPFDSYINIYTDSSTTYELYDFLGRLLIKGNEKVVNASSIQKGIYLLKVASNKTIPQTIRITKHLP
jgi:hypothetical protein